MTRYSEPRRVEGVSNRGYAHYVDLGDAVVLITGGASGIGAYFTHAFAVQGAKVAFVSLPDDPADQLCETVEAACGNHPFFQACDLKDVSQLKTCIARVEERFGAITVLINNAARDDRHTIEGLSVDEWDDSINTNLRPYYFSAQAVVAGMRATGRGCIINVGSNSANLGLAGYPAYVTAKAAIVGLTRALARELGVDNIRVNALIPGWVMTERQKALWVTEDSLAQCLAEQSLKAPIAGEDIADAALFLASARARMITGQSLIVDGGRALG
jgi:NAD(P)-dependent dehydrogenase (short-subunit alcohol dehydrogenase family)